MAAKIEKCPRCGGEIRARVTITHSLILRKGNWVDDAEPYHRDIAYRCVKLGCWSPDRAEEFRIPVPGGV